MSTLYSVSNDKIQYPQQIEELKLIECRSFCPGVKRGKPPSPITRILLVSDRISNHEGLHGACGADDSLKKVKVARRLEPAVPTEDREDEKRVLILLKITIIEKKKSFLENFRRENARVESLNATHHTHTRKQNHVAWHSRLL